MDYFLDWLGENACVRHVDLMHNPLPISTADKLAKAVQGNFILQKVGVGATVLDIALLKRSPGQTRLDLSGRQLGVTGCLLAVECLIENQLLVWLDLSENDIGVDG
jgi:hypothetical protein